MIFYFMGSKGITPPTWNKFLLVKGYLFIYFRSNDSTIKNILQNHILLPIIIRPQYNSILKKCIFYSTIGGGLICLCC